MGVALANPLRGTVEYFLLKVEWVKAACGEGEEEEGKQKKKKKVGG